MKDRSRDLKTRHQPTQVGTLKPHFLRRHTVTQKADCNCPSACSLKRSRATNGLRTRPAKCQRLTQTGSATLLRSYLEPIRNSFSAPVPNLGSMSQGGNPSHLRCAWAMSGKVQRGTGPVQVAGSGAFDILLSTSLWTGSGHASQSLL